MNFIASGVTDIGLTRDTNQDSYGVKIVQTRSGKMAFAVLCDGMGGYAKGEVASATMVSVFLNWVNTRLPVLSSDVTETAIQQEWEQLVFEYNHKIGMYGSNTGITLGTTLSAVLLTEKQYFIIHVGDSRIYEISDHVALLTKDQTVVAREVEQGILTEEQAKIDPRRSVLLQCIGASEQVVPDFITGEVKKNAVYMLCSDGFCHEITNQEIYTCLNPDLMCEAVQMSQNMRILIELDKQRKERDNISVVSIRTY